MKYISTRNKKIKVSAQEAIVQGLSSDGGLFVPSEFPVFLEKELRLLMSTDYRGKAEYILSCYLPDFDKADIKNIVKASVVKFEDQTPSPVVKLDETLYVMELWHGPTAAFKDLALTILPNLITSAQKIEKVKEKLLILAATSGDTGKAAIEGFSNVEGTAAIAIFPDQNVSRLQKLQMITQEGNNVGAIGINGNFDDTQRAVKQIFNDPEAQEYFLKKGYRLSSANSINLGRLLPQIVYYFSSYLDLVEAEEIELGDKINYVVPSGNFGNILAGYYAYKMGLPINKLICASNSNNVLTEFLNEGRYDARRELQKTISPSMDIIISSNTERLIFELSGRDDKLTAERMKQLSSDKNYNLSEQELAQIESIFYADYTDDEGTRESLFNIFEEYGYLADPHTAVAFTVYNSYLAATGDDTKTVVVSTASPYKFVDYVLEALEETVPADDLKAIDKLSSLTATEPPAPILEAYTKPIRHKTVVEKDKIYEAVVDFLENIAK